MMMIMHIHQKLVTFLLLCESIAFICASKCPEARKPHVTSCTIFYNCINLPDGGYVWAPAKCAEGLVFQPYLRMCVLPGDTWTCDNLSTESSPVAESNKNPELIDPAQTSYLGYTHESSLFTDGPANNPTSYPLDGISQLGNLRLSATPYPLIEIVDTKEKANNNNNEKNPPEKNVAQSQGIEHRVENYLYEFFNSHEKVLSSSSNNNKVQENNFTWLKGFINKMLLRENVIVPMKQQVFAVVAPRPEFVSTTCEPSAENALNKNDYLNNMSSDMLTYLVQSYILGTRKSTHGKSKKKKTKNPQSTTTIQTTEVGETNNDELDSIVEESNEQEEASSIDSIINELKPDSNIVAIKGNLGGKEYVTIAKYKSLSTRVKVEVVEILLCAKGIRLANRTDCTRYYTCDPDSATVVEFSCSSKTAFNDYNRVCETQRYKTCVKERLMEYKISTTVRSILPAAQIPKRKVSTTARPIPTTQAPNLSSAARMENPGKVQEKNPCESAGKFADELSEKHYYVCYASDRNSGSMDSIRMTCPNGLIFCQEKRVCTARRRCYE